MALRKIISLPDKRLRLVSLPVKATDPGLRSFVDDMFETMYEAPGIGLAAIQTGVPKRVIVMDLAKKEDPRAPQVFINPQVLWVSDERFAYEEGCLSIPEFYEEVERPSRVRVRFFDLAGTEQELEADGLLATCIQHEIDHLNGVLFIDHISKLKRDRVIKKFTKAHKHGDDTQEQEVTLRSAALSQIHAAIEYLHGSDFAFAMSLASSAEAVLPHTDKPHLSLKLKALIASLPPVAKRRIDINALADRTERGSYEKAKIPEHEVILAIARAASKFAAVYGEQSREIKEFSEWAINQIQADKTF